MGAIDARDSILLSDVEGEKGLRRLGGVAILDPSPSVSKYSGQPVFPRCGQN